MSETTTQYKKVVLYADEKDYRMLRSKLARKGQSASDWLREKVQEEISKPEK